MLNERIGRRSPALEPELLLGPVQAQVTRHFARAEAEAGAAVLSALDGGALRPAAGRAGGAGDRPAVDQAGRRKATRELPRLVARTARRLERAVVVAIDPEMDAEQRDLAVHEARKAGKRLRYATEVARPTVGTEADRFAKALKGFQTALGEHQDTVVARAALRELGAQAHGAGKNGFSFGRAARPGRGARRPDRGAAAASCGRRRGPGATGAG